MSAVFADERTVGLKNVHPPTQSVALARDAEQIQRAKPNRRYLPRHLKQSSHPPSQHFGERRTLVNSIDPESGKFCAARGSQHQPLRWTMLLRDAQGPRAVIKALARLASSHAEPVTRVREDRSIAEMQLVDCEARLGRPFAREAYRYALSDLRDRLNAALPRPRPWVSRMRPPRPSRSKHSAASTRSSRSGW